MLYSQTIRTALIAATILLATSANAADKVKLRLDWVYGAEHAPIFLARDKGFFRDEGIDVELMPGEGSSVTVKLVGNRDAEFGYATADQALIGMSKELPIVSIAVILQKNPTALIFKTVKGLKDPKIDLYGKTIGVQLKSNTGRQWVALRDILKLDAAKLKEVPADGALVPLIASDRIDVGIGFYHNDALKLRASGESVDWILLENYGLRMYSSALITNASLIKEKPDLVRRFTRAFIKGWTYSATHPGEALKAFIAANPTTDARLAELKLPEVLKQTRSEDTDTNGIGYSTVQGWNDMQVLLVKMKMLEAPTDVTKAFTNQYLK